MMKPSIDKLILTREPTEIRGGGGTISFILGKHDYKKFSELRDKTGMNTATLGRVLMSWALDRTEFQVRIAPQGASSSG